jgi:hypothetical protein
MGRKHPEFPSSKPYDSSVSTDALLRQEPEEEEEEEEEEEDNDKDDNNDDEEEDDGYSACPCLRGEGSRFESLSGRFQAAAVSAL